MNNHRRRPVDAVYGGPATKFEPDHAKPTDGIRAGLRAIYEPEDDHSERLRTLLRILRRERAAIEKSENCFRCAITQAHSELKMKTPDPVLIVEDEPLLRTIR